MRRGLLVALTLALLSASLFGAISSTQAHTVMVDGGTTEWSTFGTAPSEDNTAHIARNSLGQGEFIWLDEGLDHRLINTTVYTREVDFRQVRVTGDQNNLSVYVQLAGATQIDPAADLPQLQIAIDTGVAGGQTQFVSPATITPTVSTAAAWEYLLQTRFKSGTQMQGNTYNIAPVNVFTNLASSTTAGSAVLQKNDNTIELQVHWSAIPLTNTLPDKNLPPTRPLRFTVVMLRESGSPPIPADGTGTNILDTITPSYPGDPDGVQHTLNELRDGVIDYSFTVNFENGVPVSSPNVGEVYSPLLITEVGLYPTLPANAAQGDPNAQWIEITNVSGATLSGATLSQYKIGDATQRTSNEGMFRLPNRNNGLAAGASIIIARDEAKFETAYSQLANNNSVYFVSNLTPAGNWATGTGLSLLNSTTAPAIISDQVVLLDSSDTIADLVEYTNTTPLPRPYPDHTPVAVSSTTAGSDVRLALNTAIQRCPSARDTNNRDAAKSDWVTTTAKADQTPLTACTFTDLAVTKSGPQNIVVSVTAPVEQQYVVSYTNNRLVANSVRITDTLPLGMSYVAGSTVSSASGIAEPTVTTVNDRTVLVWNVGTVAASATGQITLTTSLAADTAPATGLSSEVAIGSATRETGNDLFNNSSTLTPISYTTEPVVDVTVGQSVVAADSNLYAGGRVVYRVSYANNGAKAAGGITLIDGIPAGLIYVSNSKGFAADTSTAGQVTLTVPGALAANSATISVDLVFAISETLAAGASIDSNSVTIATTTTPEIDTANNTSTSSTVTLGERPATADLSVSTAVKDASKAIPGGTIVYTVSYANTGTQDALGVTLVDQFPSNLEYASNSARLVPNQSVSGQLTFNLIPLAPGNTGTIDITFNVKASTTVGTKVSNSVTIATTSPEGPITNNTATSSETEIIAGPDQPVETTYTVYLPLVKR